MTGAEAEQWREIREWLASEDLNPETVYHERFMLEQYDQQAEMIVRLFSAPCPWCGGSREDFPQARSG